MSTTIREASAGSRWSRGHGAGVVELNGRLLWSKAVSQDLRGNQLVFQGITASADGRRVAFDVLR
jgi:hypothetical protein